MSFFHKNNFNRFVGEDQAMLVAKIANKIMCEKGDVVFGRYFTNGESKNFSTEQTKDDTHVALIVDMSEMGSFAPSDGPIHVDLPSKQDEIQALAERAKLLELENMQLRGKK